MNSKIQYSLKIDLSKLPSDIIPCISAHLTDSTILNESLRNKRTTNYLLYFFLHNNIPKDAKQLVPLPPIPEASISSQVGHMAQHHT